MKHLLVAPLLLIGFGTFAQAVDCAAIKKENDALKEEIAVYKARLNAGATGVAVASDDADYQAKFVACTASKRTQTATLTFLLENTGPVTLAFIRNSQFANSGAHTRAFDEQGNAYKSGKTLIGTDANSTKISPNLPIKCTVELLSLPLTATNLKQGEVVLLKTPAGGGMQQDATLTFRNVPIVWKP